MTSLINKAFSDFGPYTLLTIIFLFSVFQLLIQYWIQSKFSNEANKQLEVYKVITGGDLNRKIKFIEKEYVAISECWSSFTKAYDSIKYGHKFYPACDFHVMGDEKIERFLREFNFSSDQISEIKKSKNYNDFIEIDQNNRFKKFEELLENFRDVLYANEIFMEEDIVKKFDHFLAISQKALWGLRAQLVSKTTGTLGEAQGAVALLLKDQTRKERDELLCLIKKSLQKDNSVVGKEKTCQRIADFFGRVKEKVKVWK